MITEVDSDMFSSALSERKTPKDATARAGQDELNLEGEEKLERVVYPVCLIPTPHALEHTSSR